MLSRSCSSICEEESVMGTWLQVGEWSLHGQPAYATDIPKALGVVSTQKEVRRARSTFQVGRWSKGHHSLKDSSGRVLEHNVC